MFQLTKVPVATAQVVIDRPVEEVFEAFVSPDIITEFWFDRSSGRLENGAVVYWTWASPDATAEIRVRRVAPNARILIDWDSHPNPTTVEWTFTPQHDSATHVLIENRGFAGNGDAIVAAALDAIGGFAMLLANAKSWLERGQTRPNA